MKKNIIYALLCVFLGTSAEAAKVTFSNKQLNKFKVMKEEKEKLQAMNGKKHASTNTDNSINLLETNTAPDNSRSNQKNPDGNEALLDESSDAISKKNEKQDESVDHNSKEINSRSDAIKAKINSWSDVLKARFGQSVSEFNDSVKAAKDKKEKEKRASADKELDLLGKDIPSNNSTISQEKLDVEMVNRKKKSLDEDLVVDDDIAKEIITEEQEKYPKLEDKKTDASLDTFVGQNKDMKYGLRDDIKYGDKQQETKYGDKQQETFSDLLNVDLAD